MIEFAFIAIWFGQIADKVCPILNTYKLFKYLSGILLTATMVGCAAAEGPCTGPPVMTFVACTADWNPVCGCNDETYPNACHAMVAGVLRHTPGECE